MSPVWDADYEITAESATSLIANQFPALASVHVELLGVGWDNVAFRVNRDFVFRFPRRQLGANLLEHELRILPLLAPNVPLPIPLPQYHGRPANGYPYEFAGYRMIPGVTACQVTWTDATCDCNVTALAHFLLALHTIPVDGEVRSWAPGDELGRADVGRRAPTAKKQIANIAGLVPVAELEAAEYWIDQWVNHLGDTSRLPDATCWVHGDLYARHLLVDTTKRICGVIDWGDVHLGDAALDLSIVYSALPPEARPGFWANYGEVDVYTSYRARFRALRYGALLTAYGNDVGDNEILQVGRNALRLAIA